MIPHKNYTFQTCELCLHLLKFQVQPEMCNKHNMVGFYLHTDLTKCAWR